MKPAGEVASTPASGGTVAFAWEHKPGVSKLQGTTTAGGATKLPAEERAVATTKKEAVPHRIRVRPPPGASGRGCRRRGGGAVVRPEEDPFLAAFLACTERGNKAPKGGHRLLGLGFGLGLGSGLGLSCKGPGGVVQSVVRLAKMPQALNDD